MNKRLRYRLIVLAMMVSAVLSGCGSGYDTGSSDDSESSEDSGGLTYGVKVAPGIGMSVDGDPMIPMGPSSGGISMGMGF